MSFGNMINLTSANSLNRFSNAHSVAYDLLVEEEELRKIFCKFIKEFILEADKIKVISQAELSNSMQVVLKKFKSSHEYPVLRPILEREYTIKHVVKGQVVEEVVTGRYLLIKGYLNHCVDESRFDIIKKDFFKKILNPWIKNNLSAHDITKSFKRNILVKPNPPTPHVHTVDELLKEVINNISPKALEYKNADEFAKESVKQMKKAVMDDEFVKFLRKNRQARKEFYAVFEKAKQYFENYYKFAELSNQQASYEARKEVSKVMSSSFVDFKKTLTGSKNLLTYIRNDIVANETITALKSVANTSTSKQVAKDAAIAAKRTMPGTVEKAAGKTVAKAIFKRGLAILGPITTAWGIYDVLSGKDFPVHSGESHSVLYSTSYTKEEEAAALELYTALNSKAGGLTPYVDEIIKFRKYPTFFVYLKFAKDKRIQNMPPRKVKSMINLTINCINNKNFTVSEFNVDNAIKAFDDLEKMNGLFGK